MPLSRRLIAFAYVAWALFVFTVTLLKDGLSADNVTHLGIAAYLALSVLAIPLLAFFTIERLQHLAARYDWRGPPLQQVNEFKGRAIAANAPSALE